jgi:flagellar biosynthesis/type III secretory pathway ATPase
VISPPVGCASAFIAPTALTSRLSEDVVRAGMHTGLSVRSAFTALPRERLGEPITDDLRSVFAGRIELTRYLVDIGLQVDTGRVLDSLAA